MRSSGGEEGVQQEQESPWILELRCLTFLQGVLLTTSDTGYRTLQWIPMDDKVRDPQHRAQGQATAPDAQLIADRRRWKYNDHSLS
jgi:hypothetical protein